MIFGISRRKGLVSVTSAHDAEAQAVATQFNIRCVPYHNLYDTLTNVVVIADPNLQIGSKKSEFNPAYLRPHMTVLDVTTMPSESPILAEARSRGAKIVEAIDVYADQLATQFKSATGQDLPAADFRKELIAATERKRCLVSPKTFPSLVEPDGRTSQPWRLLG